MASNIVSFTPKQERIVVADPKVYSTAYDRNSSDEVPAPVSDTPSRHEVDAKVKASAAEVRAEFHELRADVASMRSEIKTELASVRVEMAGIRSEMADGRAEVANGNANLVKWFVGTSVSMAGVLIAAMSFLFNANKPALPQSPTQPIVISLPATPPAPAAAPATNK